MITRTQIHISNLRQGMTVEVNKELITVSKCDINHNSFMGYSFRGDASKQMMTQVQFIVPTNKGIVLR